jgi:hypothetical protein
LDSGGVQAGWASVAKVRLAEWRSDSGSTAELAWRVVTWVVLAYAAVQAAHAYAAGFREPLLDRHAFRQAQTAISAYWIAHGGPLLAYETPVFGAPYSAPFEFPLYQWIVAILHRVTRVGLDQTGRVVSVAFFVLTTVPFFRLLRRSGVSAGSARLAVAVLLVAPEYLYWSRTFLIESTALFLSLSALALGVEILDRGAPLDRRLAWLAGTTTLALLVKVTTAFGYVLALGVIALAYVARDPERRSRARAYGAYFAAAFVVPALPLLAWTRFADHEKSVNPLAHFITSAALHDWNYGTWAQKTALATWQTFWDRTMDETFGSPLGFVACAALAVFASKKVATVVAMVVGVVATYAVFTNVHLVHEYYQYSTCAFAVVVVGIGFGAAEGITPRARPLLVGLAALMIWKSTSVYEGSYLHDQTHVDRALVRTGEFVRDHTASSALIAIYGDDWSSIVPYYSERHALMDRENHEPSDPVIRDALERSAAQGNPLGAVISCNRERYRSRDHAAKLLGHAPQCTAFPSCDVCL